MYFIGIPLFALKTPKRFILNNSLARPGIVDKAIMALRSQTNDPSRHSLRCNILVYWGKQTAPDIAGCPLLTNIATSRQSFRL
jgi:hypothetical protein